MVENRELWALLHASAWYVPCGPGSISSCSAPTRAVTTDTSVTKIQRVFMSASKKMYFEPFQNKNHDITFKLLFIFAQRFNPSSPNSSLFRGSTFHNCPYTTPWISQVTSHLCAVRTPQEAIPTKHRRSRRWCIYQKRLVRRTPLLQLWLCT